MRMLFLAAADGAIEAEAEAAESKPKNSIIVICCAMQP